MLQISNGIYRIVLVMFFLTGFNPIEIVLVPAKSSDTPVITPFMLFTADYTGHFSSQLDSCQCPGASIAIVKDSSEVYANGYGTVNISTQKMVNEKTIFRLGSVSKGFAAVMAGILADRNLLDWNDRVTEYLPYFELNSKEQTERIRIEHILSHTTGLPIHSYTNLVEYGKSVKYIAKELVNVPLLGEEGTIYAYQNAAYSIIEEIIYSVTGQSYAKMLEKQLFASLEMDHASTSYEAISKNKNKALPHYFSRKAKNYNVNKISKKYYNSVSSGGVNASASDMTKWLSLLLGNHPEIIKPSTLKRIFTPVIKTSHARRYFNRWQGVNDSYYGLGWRILDYKGRTIAYHGGYVNGFRTEIAVDLNKKIAACFMFNSTCSYAKTVIPDFLEQYDLYQQNLEQLTVEAQ